MAKPKIGSIDEITKKYIEVTPNRATYYEAGVGAPKEDWEKNTVAASKSYKAAVSAADIERRFSGGAKKAGTAKWQRKARDVGVGRYGPGVMAAESDYRTGLDPYVPVIAAVEMSERQPRGSDANWERSKQVGNALHKKRLALIGAGA
jgi:hypothetical protein